MIGFEPDKIAAAIARAGATFPVGRVTALTGTSAQICGLAQVATLGDRVHFFGEPAVGEVIGTHDESVTVSLDRPAETISTGHPVYLRPKPEFAPHDGWIGRVIDPDGVPLDGRPIMAAASAQPLTAAPPPPGCRRPLGERIATGLAVFDTLLPLARGQRIGLFAGSGVGKSTLLASLATGLEADIIVIGLVGERGRELREFIDNVLGPAAMARCVIIAATSDRAAHTRRRCALAATSVAEYFRDAGKHVLLLLDSVTRFAEAHREVAVTSGEPPSLRGFPASTTAAIASLCERAGPGVESKGDITAIYTVLVAGSDMEEPIADILRGVLDGHVVLDRSIAERGRYPAIDVIRSVSRSLPDIANADENRLIATARKHLGVYERAELMIQSGLYTQGSDIEIDAAIAFHPLLDTFCTRISETGPAEAFAVLRNILERGQPDTTGDPSLPLTFEDIESE